MSSKIWKAVVDFFLSNSTPPHPFNPYLVEVTEDIVHPYPIEWFTREPRPTFEAICERLETAIFVTNKIDSSLVPKGPAVVPYYVNVPDSYISAWHRALVLHWADQYQTLPEPYFKHSIAGCIRGRVDGPPMEDPQSWYFMHPRPNCEAERDQIYLLGLNHVRPLIGIGNVIWDSQLWANGKPLTWSIDFSDPDKGAENRATVHALIHRGVLPERI